MKQAITRAWSALAPKLVAFLATGLTASGVIYVAQLLGVAISPTLAALLVGGVSSVAAYVQRDSLLELAPAEFSMKVVIFIVTSASATSIVALLAEFGVDLSDWSAVIGAVLTVIAAALGYSKRDYVLAA